MCRAANATTSASVAILRGGGYGFTSVTFGMNCDNVISMRVMLFDGSIVVATPPSTMTCSGRCVVAPAAPWVFCWR